jgi:hypothetical protein
MPLKSAAVMVALMAVGVLAAPLDGVARHRTERGKASVGSGPAASDKSAGPALEKPPEAAKDGKPPAGQGDDTALRGNSAPLDLSITVFQGRGRNVPPKGLPQPKGLAGKPTGALPLAPAATIPEIGGAKDPREVRHIIKSPVVPGATVVRRNAIGAIIDHGKAGDRQGPLGSVANPTKSDSRGIGATGSHGTVKPVAAAGPVGTNPAGLVEGQDVRPGAASVVPLAVTAPATMIRPPARTALGGPVKMVSGLSGSGVHSRHP